MPSSTENSLKSEKSSSNLDSTENYEPNPSLTSVTDELTVCIQLLGPPSFGLWTKDVNYKSNKWFPCVDFTHGEALRHRILRVKTNSESYKRFITIFQHMEKRSPLQNFVDREISYNEEFYFPYETCNDTDLNGNHSGKFEEYTSKNENLIELKRNLFIIDNTPSTNETTTTTTTTSSSSMFNTSTKTIATTAITSSNSSWNNDNSRIRKCTSFDKPASKKYRSGTYKSINILEHNQNSDDNSNESENEHFLCSEKDDIELSLSLWNELPIEIWLLILGFLPPPSLIAASRVCKMFYHTIQFGEMWKKCCTKFSVSSPLVVIRKSRKKPKQNENSQQSLEDLHNEWRITYQILSRIRCVNCGKKGLNTMNYAARLLGIILCVECKEKDEYKIMPLTSVLRIFGIRREMLICLKRITKMSCGGIFQRFFLMKDCVALADKLRVEGNNDKNNKSMSLFSSWSQNSYTEDDIELLKMHMGKKSCEIDFTGDWDQ